MSYSQKEVPEWYETYMRMALVTYKNRYGFEPDLAEFAEMAWHLVAPKIALLERKLELAILQRNHWLENGVGNSPELIQILNNELDKLK